MKSFKAISKIALLFLATLLIVACASKEDKVIESVAIGFGQHYFNLRFADAAKMCTPESQKWISYRATNITQSDLDVYNAQSDTAVCDIDDFEEYSDSAKISLKVCNFLSKDSIGDNAHICEEATFVINLKKEGSAWHVDLREPL